MSITLLLALSGSLHAAHPPAPAAPVAIIDMHLHADSGTSKQDWPEVLRNLDRHQVKYAALSVKDPAEAHWHKTGGKRFLVGPAFPCYEGLFPRMEPCFPQTRGWPDLAWLRGEYAAGRMRTMGELLHVYYGLAPDDEQMAPYWALAAEMDVPVGSHVGRGPFRRAKGCCPRFDDDLGNPALLEPVLRRHPQLRLWLMHAAGWDYLDETIALMKAHPNVYAELSIVNSVAPAQMHTDALRALLDAGLGDRIMFGSDNMPLAPIIERIEAVPFLTPLQKRAIYYDNAARFLRLEPER